MPRGAPAAVIYVYAITDAIELLGARRSGSAGYENARYSVQVVHTRLDQALVEHRIEAVVHFAAFAFVGCDNKPKPAAVDASPASASASGAASASASAQSGRDVPFECTDTQCTVRSITDTLKTELDAADRAADRERADAAEAERDAFLAERRRASGLGGRPRETSA